MITYTKKQLQNNKKYLELLSKSFPTTTSAVGEVVNLKSILNLPKGTEHFLTDIHGEHEAFNHVMQNASGTIKRKIHEIFEDSLSFEDQEELATLIYYPKEKIDLISQKKSKESLNHWYKVTIYHLVKVCRESASKYTRSKVRKAFPKDFGYIMEELLQENENRFNKKEYYHEIIDSLVQLNAAGHFIIEISGVIKRLTIDHLHIIGDIYDRGAGPDMVMETLMQQHSLDMQWGNHDILWMGASAGNPCSIANVIRIALRYANMDVLENGYGINILPLASFANRTYNTDPCQQFNPKLADSASVSKQDITLMTRMHKAISIIQFKLEESLIDIHPDYHMEKRQLLRKINYTDFTIEVDGQSYLLNDTNFPTIDPQNPSALNDDEALVMERLINTFTQSEKLQKHIRFMYAKGSMYKVYNNNLLFHACIPLTSDGNFKEVIINNQAFSGKSLMDKYDQMARDAFFNHSCPNDQNNTDFLWFLWCHADSPLFGKDKMATFERYFIDDKVSHKERYEPFYPLIDDDPTIATKILLEFGVDPDEGHVINGHIPVKTIAGESPIRANGKQLVIDGGFAKAYQKTTGIAGYTLTYNSYGLILISHDPFESVEKAIKDGVDINSTQRVIEKTLNRKRVRDTDNGKELLSQIDDLEMLIAAYNKGIIKEKLF